VVAGHTPRSVRWCDHGFGRHDSGGSTSPHLHTPWTVGSRQVWTCLWTTGCHVERRRERFHLIQWDPGTPIRSPMIILRIFQAKPYSDSVGLPLARLQPETVRTGSQCHGPSRQCRITDRPKCISARLTEVTLTEFTVPPLSSLRFLFLQFADVLFRTFATNSHCEGLNSSDSGNERSGPCSHQPQDGQRRLPSTFCEKASAEPHCRPSLSETAISERLGKTLPTWFPPMTRNEALNFV